MKKILVTGAGGFIGSHVTELLAREGYSVRAFVHYNAANRWGWLEDAGDDVKKSLDVVLGDIRDAHAVSRAAKGCDAVCHLAALISIPYSYQAAQSYAETNVLGTLHVLEAAREHGLSRVILTSTSETYGTAQFVPITEKHPLNAQSPYAASKTGGDQMGLSFHASFGLPVLVLRPFNTYGPRQSARAVIPTIITQLLRGERRIKLGSLHPTRDFNYVGDTARGFLAALRSGAVGEVVNVGSNYEISIGETAELIARIAGVEAEIATDDARVRPEASEVCRLWADNSRAKELLGWTPEHGGREGFAEGLRKTVDWFRANPQPEMRRYAI